MKKLGTMLYPRGMALSLALIFVMLGSNDVLAQYNPGPGFKVAWTLDPRSDPANFTPGPAFGANGVLAGMDLDRDGRREILFTTDETLAPGGPDPGILAIFLYEANGNNNYQHVWHYTMPEKTNSHPPLAYGDIDKDGKSEIYFGAPTINNTTKLFIFEQDASGVFPNTPTLTYDYGRAASLDFRPAAFQLDDVDKDGKIELITQSRTANRRELVVISLAGDQLDEFAAFNIEFEAGDTILGGGANYDVHVVDFDGDGKKEIWANTWDNWSMAVFEADSINKYSLQLELNEIYPVNDPGSFNRHDLLFRNIDSDTKLEAWFPMTDGKLYFLDDKTDVSKITKTDIIPVGTYSRTFFARGASLGDIDADGRPDIVASLGNVEKIARIEYIGIGSPADSSSYEWSTILDATGGAADYFYPLRIAPVDLDGDGLREAVITNRNASATGQPLLIVLEYDPASAPTTAKDWEFRNAIAHSNVDSLYRSDNTGNSRSVIGGFDLDQDGKKELILTDYSAINVRLFEYNQQANVFELKWSAPPDTAKGKNRRKGSSPRAVTVGDLDGDNKWEIMYPLASTPSGWYVYEWDGVTGSDNYGAKYSSIINTEIDSCCAANVTAYAASHEGIPFIVDVDKDGRQELLLATSVAATGGKRGLQIINVEGDIEHNSGGSGFETWRTEFLVNSAGYGGGTPIQAIPADLDGDDTFEIVTHTFNFFNFFNVDVLGPNSYKAPDPASPTRNIRVTDPLDQVARYGGDVADIDGDGTDEVYFPNNQTRDLYVIDYNRGEDILSIDANHVVKVIPNFGNNHASIFDVDKNGRPNIIVGGGYPRTIVSAEFLGNNPRDPAAYKTSVIYIGENDIFTGAETNRIDIVVKDSLGVMTTTQSISNRFVTKVQAHYKDQPIDFDNDGDREIIASFQSNQDSIGTLSLTWNPTAGKYDSVFTRIKNPKSWALMRFEFTGVGTGVEGREVSFITPNDYVLEQNYPNPFNPSTTIQYALPLNKRVTLRIYNLMGQVVRTLVDNELQNVGRHTVTWDGRDAKGYQVATGTYIYSLEFDNFRKTRRMMLVK